MAGKFGDVKVERDTYSVTIKDVQLLALRRILYDKAKACNPKQWTRSARVGGRVDEVALNPAGEAA